MHFHSVLAFAAFAQAAVILDRASTISTEVNHKINYDGYKVIRVAYDSYKANTDAIVAATEQLSDEPPQLGHVDLLVAPKHVKELDALNLKADVLHEDLGAAIKQEEAETVALDVHVQAASDAWFNAYHPYADHQTLLSDLVALFPGKAELVSSGTSYQGRNISGIHFWGSAGKGKKPAVVLHSNVHAREWITSMVNEYIAYQLITRYSTDATIKSYVDKYDFYVFPLVNPDGFVYTQTNTRLWRKNRQPNTGSTCVGTDPNRNWAVGWNTGGSSTDPCDETYRGASALSAPETKGLAAYLNKLRDTTGVKLYIDWHSYSQLWMYPYGYSCTLVAANSAELDSLSRGAVAAIKASSGLTYEYGPTCQTIYQASGSSIDYANDVSKSQYTFTAELRDTGTYGFVLPAAQIRPNAEEIWSAMKYLFANMK